MSSMTIPRIDPADLALLPRADLERFNDLLQEYHRRQVRVACQKSFAEFAKHAWPVVEMDALVWEPHMQLLCDAMQAFDEKRIRRLLINIPPGTAKSLIVSVLYPAWVWTHRPRYRLLALSGSEKVAIRDSVKCRRLVSSDWYVRHFINDWKLTSDVNQKSNFENTKGGFRDSESIGAKVTGRRGDDIILDDPNDADDVRSELERQKVLDRYDEKLSTRLNSIETGGIVLIQQRLHDKDLSGHILSTMGEEEWETIILPMEYDGKRYRSKLGLNDWRKKNGEILTPLRLGEKKLRILKKRLGIYGTAGQLQQSPSPREGGILPRSGFRIWTERKMPPVTDITLSFDLSFKEQENNDPSAFVALGIFEFEETNMEHLMYKQMRTGVIVLRAWSRHLRFGQMKQAVVDEQKRFTVDGEIPNEILIEDKANGPGVISELDQIGVRVFGYNPGALKKVDRAILAQDIFDDGLIWVPGKPILEADYRQDDALPEWAESLVAECALFPNGTHDDQVDAIVQGVRRLRDRGDIVLTSDLREPDDDGSDDDLPRTQTGELVSPYGAD